MYQHLFDTAGKFCENQLKTVVTCAIIACNFAAILAGVAKIIIQLF